MICKDCGGNIPHHKEGCKSAPHPPAPKRDGCAFFYTITIPSIMGDDIANPIQNGEYKNTLVRYEANGAVYLCPSDGVPIKLTYATTDYNALTNKPTINGITMQGNQSSSSLGIGFTIDSELSETSTNPVQNSAIYEELQRIWGAINGLGGGGA